ncbi:hypothetical protein IMZ31_23560 (plasmid) [Pontibacillus sp. ALD_SL1]|uniref:hypothetical protein n=1 Tax=Pontibacillus sp. ALD_SL1 TaxID=2777185 RepID=UPI001A97D275|nr:hypothetical protein [Pontibacillus sp. ALD_SL1]QST02430.1 hypothetical protein IMZ31_23560 [Pontibacillus sp. ALD_SL1]
MGLHINETKGDFVFQEWEENACEAFEEKQKEIEEGGYLYKGKEEHYLHTFCTFEKEGNELVLTMSNR